MPTYKSTAIVLRTTTYSESSLIIDMLTESKGLRSFIVSGVRGSKGRNKASYFQHLSLLEIVAYDRDDGKLARIKEYKIAHHYKTLTGHVVKSNLALFVLEITRNAIREAEQNQGLFDFVWSSLIYIDDTPWKQLSHFPITYALRLSDYIGIYPLNNFCGTEKPYFDLLAGDFTHESESRTVLTAASSVILHSILSSMEKKKDWPTLTKADRNRVLDEIIRYYSLQLSQFPDLKTVTIIRNIL